MKFVLSSEPLRVEPVDAPAAGGFVTFEGRVRNHADGREVIGLEYEAYSEMAHAQGAALLSEAITRFGLTDARAVHRTGKLMIGEVAVIVQAASAHRREAFGACEWIMDQLKWRIPIWKRETYADGVSDWVSAGAAPSMPEDQEMFIRQVRLREVGAIGQERLSNARVLLVGAGGLAAGSLAPLVGAGIGTIGIVDPDTVERSNLHRQTLFTAADIGRQKAERAATFAKRLRPAVNVHAYPEELTAQNADSMVQSYDWVVDGTDSLATKFLLNRICRKWGKPLITASVHQFEGQVLVVTPDGPCLQCLFPEVPPDHCVGTCAQSGVLGVVPFLLGGMQANEVIKGVLGLPILDRHLALIDLRTLETTRIARTVHPSCPICTASLPGSAPSWDLTVLPSEPFDLIDIRDIDEGPLLAVAHQRVPMKECYQRAWERSTIFVCASGHRSYRLAADLRAAGNGHVFSLRSGLSYPGLLDG